MVFFLVKNIIINFCHCSKVLLIVCKKRSPHWRHRQLKSKLSHRPNVSIQSGLVVRFWRHCLLSNKCGFRSRSTTNLAHRLCTESAFKHRHLSWINHRLYFAMNKNHTFVVHHIRFCFWSVSFTNFQKHHNKMFAFK